MEVTLSNIPAGQALSLQSGEQNSFDCRVYLEGFGLSCMEEGQYLQVGKSTLVQGWVLHLSSIRPQFISLLKLVVPLLANENVPFKIAKNLHAVKLLMEGFSGYQRMGKLICVYCESDNQALRLAKKLIPLTEGIRSPSIQTDRLLGGVVFTRYEGYNPIIKTNHLGEEIPHIYDSAGHLIEDRYHAPFIMPPGVKWPFYEIEKPEAPVRQPLWNYKYRPLAIIRNDIKGRVIQANFFKSPFNIQLCLIKEGIKNVWTDEFGRDVTDRLKWQFELARDLEGSIPIPAVYELFQECDNTYLVMQFIKGQSLDEKIGQIYSGQSWFQFSSNQKKKILEYLLKILASIEILHSKGYVHRDITPANFLIDRKDNIFLIDLELAYSVALSKPTPPFKYGTAGYISPEQGAHQVPTIKEDIYAIGAMMIFMFTGLSPVKFDVSSYDIQENLTFFTENVQISTLITKCLALDPGERPTLKVIIETIKNYFGSIKQSIQTKKIILQSPTPDKLWQLIDQGLRAFSTGEIISSNFIWSSRNVQDRLEGRQSFDRIQLPGFYIGVSGILYLVSLANRMGYDISSCERSFYPSQEYIQAHVLDENRKIGSGLYDGTAGIAIAIAEGMHSGLLVANQQVLEHLKSCFNSVSSTLELSNGIAGQGIALLKCRPWLEEAFIQSKLTEYINLLLGQQQSDGSWNNLRQQKGDNLIGLSFGSAGILWFLIAYAQHYRNDRVLTTIEKGLLWLYKKAHRKSGKYSWYTSTKSSSVDRWSCDMGIPGIALVLIKAFQLLGDPLYRRMAEGALESLPEHPTHNDFTQMAGLSGLGEVYLEANKAFETNHWQQRIDWITNVFSHTFIVSDAPGGYWSVNAYPDLDPDLMTGIGGIVHFLMRVQNPNKISHILSS